MMRFVYSASSLAVLVLTGCATQKQTIPPRLSAIDHPPLGEEHTSPLGETVVEKGRIYVFDGVRLENSISAGDGVLLKKFSLQPGILKATLRDDERLYYTTDKLTVYDAMLGTQVSFGGLAVRHTDPENIKFHWNGTPVLTPKPKPILVKTEVPDAERTSLRQELIYNGRIEDTLRFLYRESSSDVIRGSFSQELQYDLKDGNTIEFRGVVIEVLDATNALLKYRVVSTFAEHPQAVAGSSASPSP